MASDNVSIKSSLKSGERRNDVVQLSTGGERKIGFAYPSSGSSVPRSSPTTRSHSNIVPSAPIIDNPPDYGVIKNDDQLSTGGGEKKIGFMYPSQGSGGRSLPNSRSNSNIVPSTATTDNQQFKGRKPSAFVFNQITDFGNLTLNTAKSGLGFGEKFAYWFYNKIRVLSRKWFTHCFLTIILILYTVGGALCFKTIEGPNEPDVEELDIRELTYKFVEELEYLSHEMPLPNDTDRWMPMAEEKLNKYLAYVLENHRIKAFIKANRGDKVWTTWNSIVFCATIYTTIGYGHMYPKTNTGRALTIVYALIGIPLFLIALTDFGKLFTRCIKFLWSFVRRLYYTGNCRRVRKTAGVDDIFKGAQKIYDLATFRKSSTDGQDPENPDQIKYPQSPTTTPTTPAISNFEIDDEFNLPISLALFILVSYIFCGACIYMVIENWRFFESFYFVFISMSTIGFGDYVPRHPIFMIGSIIYLVFGLALMSMCFNVVQTKLSDTFKQASAKIGETMGLTVDADGSIIASIQENVKSSTTSLEQQKR